MLYREGLDLKMKKPELVKPLLQPFPPDQMAGYPVSEKVNKADQEGPECVRPVDAEL
jgi:putative SOS response-associated peptidase YedK